MLARKPHKENPDPGEFDPNLPVLHKRLSNGLSQVTEIFCRLAAKFSEEELDNKRAICLYESIPGVKKQKRPSQKIYGLLRSKKIRDHIELYRMVYNKDRLSLLAEREDKTNKIVERWEKDDSVQVKTADLLVALKDRETAYGMHKDKSSPEDELLKNPRLLEAMEIIDVTPKK